MPISEGISRLQCARAVFNPTGITGERTVAAHILPGDVLPDNAVIMGGFVDVITTFVSAGADAGTIAIHVNGANDIVTAIAISDVSNPWDAGFQAIIPKINTPQTTSVKTTAARAITATVGGQALTAGKLVVFLFYVVSD